MMKSIIKFLLLCGFLFLGGYAHTSQAPNGFSENTLEQSLQAAYPVVQSHPAFFTAAPVSRIKKLAFRLKATKEEDDDDDDDFFKEHPRTDNGCIPSFYTATGGCFSNCLAGRLPFCEHFSNVSTLKFIMHCVIRI
jgi:hypothetical protein